LNILENWKTYWFICQRYRIKCAWQPIVISTTRKAHIIAIIKQLVFTYSKALRNIYWMSIL